MIVFKGKWIEMHNVDSYEFMNRHRKPKAVAIIAITKDNKLVITEQKRKPFDGVPIFEIPAGLVDDNETSTETAIRELEEETGYKGKFVKLYEKIATTPGICTEAIDIAIFNECEKVSKGGGLASENEFIKEHLIDILDPISVTIENLSKKGIVSLTLFAGLNYAQPLFR